MPLILVQPPIGRFHSKWTPTKPHRLHLPPWRNHTRIGLLICLGTDKVDIYLPPLFPTALLLQHATPTFPLNWINWKNHLLTSTIGVSHRKWRVAKGTHTYPQSPYYLFLVSDRILGYNHQKGRIGESGWLAQPSLYWYPSLSSWPPLAGLLSSNQKWCQRIDVPGTTQGN